MLSEDFCSAQGSASAASLTQFLSAEALPGFKIQLISLLWKRVHQGLIVLLASSLEHPFAAFVRLLQTCSIYRETVKILNRKEFPFFLVPPVCSNTSDCHTGEASSRTSLYHAKCSFSLATLDEIHPRHPGLFAEWLNFLANFFSGIASKLWMALWSANKQATGQRLTQLPFVLKSPGDKPSFPKVRVQLSSISSLINCSKILGLSCQSPFKLCMLLLTQSLPLFKYSRFLTFNFGWFTLSREEAVF